MDGISIKGVIIGFISRYTYNVVSFAIENKNTLLQF